MVLMSDTGGGHRASAEALKAGFQKLYGDKYEARPPRPSRSPSAAVLPKEERSQTRCISGMQILVCRAPWCAKAPGVLSLCFRLAW